MPAELGLVQPDGAKKRSAAEPTRGRRDRKMDGL
jgi:hypothetical protein